MSVCSGCTRRFIDAKIRISENKRKKSLLYFALSSGSILCKDTNKREQCKKKLALFCFVERKYLL